MGSNVGHKIYHINSIAFVKWYAGPEGFWLNVTYLPCWTNAQPCPPGVRALSISAAGINAPQGLSTEGRVGTTPRGLYRIVGISLNLFVGGVIIAILRGIKFPVLRVQTRPIPWRALHSQCGPRGGRVTFQQAVVCVLLSVNAVNAGEQKILGAEVTNGHF